MIVLIPFLIFLLCVAYGFIVGFECWTIVLVFICLGIFYSWLRNGFGEIKRTYRYNHLIQVENDWQNHRVSDDDYQKVRLAFYRDFPNGDISL